jgi:hypothetical protein
MRVFRASGLGSNFASWWRSYRSGIAARAMLISALMDKASGFEGRAHGDHSYKGLANSPKAFITQRWCRLAHLAAALVCAFTSVEAQEQHPLDTWWWRNPHPAGSTLNAVAYGNETFVTVGAAGSILTSANGVSWTQALSGTGATLFDITFGNGRFVAVGDFDTIVVSTNGRAWSKHPSGVRRVDHVAFVNGRFRAFGNIGLARSTILTSSDGASWATNSFLSVCDMAYGHGLFVAVGPGGNIFTSPDASVWTWRDSGGTQGLTNVLFGNGAFVAAGGRALCTSVDGITWSTQTFSGWIASAAFENGKFILLAGDIWTSSDAMNWTRQPTSIQTPIKDVAFGNGTFVAVGETGTILTGTETANWTVKSDSPQPDLAAITFGNNVFVAAGREGNILSSQDGATWTERTAESPSERLNGLVHGQNLFVGVGSENRTLEIASMILWSKDGFAWEKKRLPEMPPLMSVTCGNGMFVSVGELGTIVTSTNIADWTRRPSQTDLPLRSVAFGNDRFVAVGSLRFLHDTSTNVVLISTDGAAWSSSIPLKGAGQALNVQHTENSFLLIDSNGAKFTSADGIAWTKSTADGPPLTRIAFGNGVYAGIASGIIYTSPDTRKWIPTHNPGVSLNSITYGRGTFVAAGLQGAIIQSEVLPRELIRVRDSRLRPGPSIEWTIAAPANWPLQVQASQDLKTWTGLTHIPNQPGTVIHSELIGNQFKKRFYRITTR